MIFSTNNKRKRVANSAFRIPDSAFWIPDSRFHPFHKLYENMADSKQAHVHCLLSLLRLVKTVATWKTVIESIQSL